MKCRALLSGVVALLVGSASGVAGPVVFWASDPVRPDETVVVQGDGLAAAEAVEVERVSDSARSCFVLSGARRAAVLQPSEVSVRFVLPASLKRGLYAFRVVTKEGVSTPIVLNRPDLWWAQGDLGSEASPGGWVRAFGKCLALPRSSASPMTQRNRVGRESSRTTLALRGPRTLTLPAESDCWAARAALPKDLPIGEYELRLHNGFGGDVGWSEPVKMLVRRPEPWPQKRFNVRDFGADSSGATDSTSAIKRALAAAEQNGGGIVFFPRGRYMVADTLAVPRFTLLRGEARDLAALFWTDTDEPLAALIRGTNSFGVEDLSLYATRYKHFITGDLGSKPEAGDVFLRRLLVRGVIYRPAKEPEKVHQRFLEAAGYASDTVQLGGRNIVISDCDLYGSGRALFLSRVQSGYVAGNTFYNGRWGWYCISGSDGLIFEKNQIIGADLMATGGGLNCLDGSTCSQNVYFARNTLKLLHGWDREAMTSDAGGGAYFGNVSPAQGKVLTLSGEPKWGGRNWSGAGVFILDGRGRGQYRRVVRHEGQRVEVDREWAVPPDGTSHVSITMLQRNYLFIGNEFSDATCAIQFYGISIHHIVADNKSLRAGGFHNIGLNYYGYQPSWFVQFLDNEVVEGNQGFNGPLNQYPPLDSHVAALGVWYEPTKAPLTRCSILRGNHLRGNARIEVGGACADTLVERNVVENAEVGIEVGGPGSHRVGEPSGVLLRDNTFHEVLTPFSGPGMDRAWLHPAERLLGRFEGGCAVLAAQGLTIPEPWAGLQVEAKRLKSVPFNDPLLSAKCGSLLGRAVDALGSQSLSGWLFPEVLLGLHATVEEDPSLTEVLQNGKGGEGSVLLKVSLEPDVPQVTVGPQWQWPGKWRAEAPSPVTVDPGKGAEVRASLKVPAGVWGTWRLPMKSELMVGSTKLTVEQQVQVGKGSVRDWMVIGPFENRDKASLDGVAHPPEERLDMKAEYDGLTGKIKWQPIQLTDSYLDLSQRLGAKENATAYSVAALRADQTTQATLTVGTYHGLRAWLNGEMVLTHSQDSFALLSKAVTLQAGTNLLMVMSSVTTGRWQVSVEVTEESSGGHLRPVPATELITLPELNPPPLPRVAEGELSHTAGVQWGLVYSDGFEGLRLSPRWRATSGGWEVNGGTLKGQNQAFLSLDCRLSAPVRIEYKARAHEPADLSAFWLDGPPDYMAGILIAFAAGGSSRIDINGENCTSASGPEATARPGRWHHAIAQVLSSGMVQLIVDDKPVVQCRQSAPLKGARYPGIWTWGQGEFDDVRIYTGVAEK